MPETRAQCTLMPSAAALHKCLKEICIDMYIIMYIFHICFVVSQSLTKVDVDKTSYTCVFLSQNAALK